MKKLLIFLTLLISLQAETTTLSHAYKEALKNEPNLQSLIYKNLSDNESINQVKSKLYPQVQGTLNYRNRKYTQNYNKKDYSEKYKSYSITASQALYNPQTHTEIDQEELKIKINLLNSEKEKQTLAYKVVKAYLDLLEFSNLVKLQEINLKTKEIKFNQVEKKYELKQLSKIDFLEAKIELGQAKADLLAQQNMLKVAKQNFTNLTSIKDTNLPTIDFEKIDLEKLTTLLNEENSDNIDIQIAKLNLAITQKQLLHSKQGHYPRLDLTFSYSKFYTNDLTVDYENDKYIGLELKIPIYQGGYNKSRSEQSRLKIISAQKNITATKEKVDLTLKELQTKLLTSIDSFNLYKENQKATKLYLETINKSYTHGLKSIVDVNEAKLKDFNTKQKMIKYFFEFLLYYVDILNTKSKINIEVLNKIDKNILVL